MKVNRMFWGLALIAALGLTSCSQEEVENVLSQPITSVTAVIPEYVSDNGTRVSVNDYQDGWQIAWEKDDRIGLCHKPNPYGVGQEFYFLESWFTLTGGYGYTKGIFSGNGFNLKPGEIYHAWYPYSEKINVDWECYEDDGHLEATFNFCGQVQTENKSTNHLRNYNYMLGELVPDGNGQGFIQFKNVGALFKVTLKGLNKDITFTELECSRVDGEPIKNVIYYSLIVNYPLLGTFGDKFSLSFGEGIKPVVVEHTTAGSIYGIVAYFTLPPQTLFDWMNKPSSVFRFTLTDSMGRKMIGYEQQEAKNPEAGKIYEYTSTMNWESGAGINKLNGHDFVDLGITDNDGNTVYWAKNNIGATNEYDAGYYLAWGETVPHYSSIASNGTITWGTGYSKGYCAATYKYANGTNAYTIFKYTKKDNQDNGQWWVNGTFKGDNKQILDEEDDAATVNWGAGWRMPTQSEWYKLTKNCDWTWVNNYNNSGKPGYKVTSKSNSNNYIFIPANGMLNTTRLDYGPESEDPTCYYWSSELGGQTMNAYGTDFNQSQYSIRNDLSRSIGNSVRPVCIIK